MIRKLAAVLLSIMVSFLYVPVSAAADKEDDVSSAEALLCISQGEEDTDKNEYDGFLFTLKENVSKSEMKALNRNISADCTDDEAENIFDDKIYYADSLETIEEIADLDTVECIEPNYIVHTMSASSISVNTDNASQKSSVSADSFTSNDKYFSSNKWAYDQMNIDELWSSGFFGEGQNGNETPTIAVLDTGMAGIGQSDSYKHQDFDYTKMPYSVKSGVSHYYDDNGHGTFVTGEIAEIMNNGIGSNGLLPDVKVIPCKVLDSKGSSTVSSTISCLDYLLKNNSRYSIDVINMSLGLKSYVSSYQDAINAAAAEGIIVVAAAGNSGTSEYDYPASFDNVISVGSTDKSSTRADYSQYNNRVDIVAPGGNGNLNQWITSAYPTYLGSSYNCMSGTSMSAPYVSCLAAMAKAFDSSYNHDRFMSLIRNTSTDIHSSGYDRYSGYGIANFTKAYEYVTGGGSTDSISSVSIPAASYRYTGSKIKPAVTVKDSFGRTLTKGTDYTVSYSGNTNVGTAAIKVTGKNSYSGTLSKTFRIIPKGTAVSKFTAASNAFRVTWKKQSVQTSGYKIQYSLYSSFKSAKTRTVSGSSKTSLTVKNLKSKKKYYVRIATYKTTGGKTYVSSWSGVKAVKTK